MDAGFRMENLNMESLKISDDFFWPQRQANYVASDDKCHELTKHFLGRFSFAQRV